MASQLPVKVLVIPPAEEGSTGLLVPMSPHSLFTLYLPNLPGDSLSLSKADVEALD